MRTLSIFLIAALLAGACDRAEPLNDVAEAAQRTEAAGSFRYELVSVLDPGTAEELTMLGEGAIHPRAERSRRRWAPEGGAFPDEDPETACPDERNELIETPTTWYLFAPTWSACEPIWFELDMPALRAQGIEFTAADVLGVGSVPTLEPLDSLSYLRRVPGEATAAGPEEVRGDDTTRYRLETSVAGGETIDVWIDGRGHVRRIHHEADVVTTLEIFDIGAAGEPPSAPEGEIQPGNWILELHSREEQAQDAVPRNLPRRS